jgi:hypothetical protein
MSRQMFVILKQHYTDEKIRMISEPHWTEVGWLSDPLQALVLIVKITIHFPVSYEISKSFTHL